MRATASAWPGWRWSTLALFLWIAVEDQLRKWLDNPLAIIAVKDVLIGWAVVSALRSRGPGERVLPPDLGRLLLWGGILSFVGSVNPRIPTFLVPVVGIHSTFFAVPLFVVGARCAGRFDHARLLLVVSLATGTLAAAAGMVQAFHDPTFLNPAPEGGLVGFQLRMVRGDLQYVAGPFLSPGRYIVFLLNALAAGIALLLLERRTTRGVVLLAAALTCAAGLVTSGAKAASVALPLVLAGTAWVAFARDRKRRRGGDEAAARRHARTLFSLGLGLSVALLVGLAFSTRLPSILGFYWEDLFSEGAAGLRARAGINLSLGAADRWTWIVGNGTGSASMGLQYVLPDALAVVEGGYVSAIWETGFLGLVFYLLLAGWLTQLYLRRTARLDGEGRALVTGLAPLVLVELWLLNALGPMLQQYTAAIPLWFWSGVVWGFGETTRGSGRR